MKSWFGSHVTKLILCVLMLISTGTACTPIHNEMEASDMMDKNRESYGMQMEELREKYKQNPRDEKIAFDYAEKLFQLGNFAESKEMLESLLLLGLRQEKPSPQELCLLAQIEYVNGNYSEAEKLFKTLAEQYPEFKEKAEYGLELVYYQTNQFSKAQNLSTAANAESGIVTMMRAFGDRKPYQVEWIESDKTIIPFLRTDPLPLVQASIEGQLYTFLIDTGAADTFLSSSLASSLGIKTIAAVEGTFAGGATAEVGYGILDAITLNGVTIHSLPVSLLPSETMEGFAAVFNNELTISGIIGIGLFKQFLVTMDYPADQLVLCPRDGQSVVQNGNAINIPFALASTHFMISKCEINGKEMNVFLDSGLATDAEILLPNNTLHYTNIPIPDTESTAGIGGAGATELQIGNFNVDTFTLGVLPETKNISGLSGIFPEDYYFDKEIGFFIDALISHGFLRNYKWTINFNSMKMTFSQ